MECIFFFWFALCLGGVKPVWKLRRQQSPLVLPRSLVLVVIEQLQGRVRNLSGPNHSICRHCSPWEWVTVLNIHKTQARHRHRRASPDQHLSCVCFLSQHTLTSVHFSGLDEPGGRLGRKVGWNRSLLRWTPMCSWIFNTGQFALFLSLRFMETAESGSSRPPWSLFGYSYPPGEGVVV